MKVLNNRGGGSISGRNASNDANNDADVTTGDGSNRRTMFLWGGCSIMSHEALNFQ